MSMRRLTQRLEELETELCELHLAKPSQEQYMQRRSEIEYEIACIEEQIEIEERMKPFRKLLIVFVCGLLAIIFYKTIVELINH